MAGTVIGFIGFGEAARAIARGLRGAGAGPVLAYDLLLTRPDAAAPLAERAEAAGVELVDSPAALAARADVLFSAVVAGAAEAVGREVAPHLRPGQLFVDLNSTSPGVKRAVARTIETAGGRFVEAAVMAAVPPHGQRVPMLLCGEAAGELVERLAPYGMRLEVLGPDVGAASAVKMLRSVIIKGLEALLVECLLGAERYGAGDRVLASIEASFPGLDWTELAHYLLGRTALHAERRAHEMGEVAATLEELGIEPIMARAAAERLQRCANAHLQDAFDEAPARYQDVIAALSRSAQ